MKQISFEDIGAVCATFAAQEGVKAGQVVKLADNATVGPCTDGEAFAGVALEEGSWVGVQVKGFLTVAASSALTPGWAVLAADGSGGVKTSASGVNCLVADYDSTAHTAVICL